MIRPRTALPLTAVATALAVGGVAFATAGPAVAAGDDGLTHAQATKARSAALKRVAGRAVSIDRDHDRGKVTYDVTVLTRGNQAREVHLDARYRALRSKREDRDGLSYAAAGRASKAALGRIRGIVTGIDVEDEGRARYEVEVLPGSGREQTVRLSSAFRVLGVSASGSDGDDD